VCLCKEVGVRMWYRGGEAIFLVTGLFSLVGGVRMVTIRSIRLTSVGNNQKNCT